MNAQRLMNLLGKFPTILGSSVMEAKDLSIAEVEDISSFGYNTVITDGLIAFDRKGDKVEMVVNYICLDYYLANKLNNAIFELVGNRMKLADFVVAAIERLNPMSCSYTAVLEEVKLMLAV